MAANPKKQLSLDTNLLLDLAEDFDWAHDFREQFQQRGYSLLIARTIVIELEWLASLGNDVQRKFADIAAARLASWNITPFQLTSLQQRFAERFSHRLIDQGLLPDDEFNDGMILAETSLAEIALLVTSDKHLLNLDEESLAVAFNEADLRPVQVAHPKRLLQALH